MSGSSYHFARRQTVIFWELFRIWAGLYAHIVTRRVRFFHQFSEELKKCAKTLN